MEINFNSGYTQKSKNEINDWIRSWRNVLNLYIAKLAASCPNEREYLIIVSDEEVSESDIKESDKFMNNIKFKFVSVYVKGTGGNLSVGAPFVDDILIELYILLIKKL